MSDIQHITIDDIDTEVLKTRAEDPDRAIATVEDYRYVYETEPESMEPIQIYDCHDHGIVCVDGWHRVAAAKLADRQMIACVVVGEGSLEDAHRYALERTNRRHGLRLSNADKRERIRQAIECGLYEDTSNREIARRLGVDDKTVASVKREIQCDGAELRTDKDYQPGAEIRTTADLEPAGKASPDSSRSAPPVPPGGADPLICPTCHGSGYVEGAA